MRSVGILVSVVVLGACGGGDGADDIGAERSDESDTASETSVTNETLADGTNETSADGTNETSVTDETSASGADESDVTDGLDTAALAERIRLTDASLDYEDDFAIVDGCVVDDPASLLTDLFEGLVPVELLGEIAVPGGASGTGLHLPVTGVTLIGCSVSPDVDGVGFDVATAPPSVEGYAREFNLPDGPIEGAEMTVEEIGDAAGGSLYTVLLTDVNEPEIQSGEVVWVDGEVMITAYGFGPELHEIDLVVLRDRLVDLVPTIVDTALR